jgi:hypothetical protein
LTLVTVASHSPYRLLRYNEFVELLNRWVWWRRQRRDLSRGVRPLERARVLPNIFNAVYH